MKKNILRATAIIVCFSILTLSIPGSISAEKKAKKFSFRFLEKPTLLVFSILPFFSPISDTGKDITLPDTNKNTLNKVKITEGVVRTKPPDED